MRSWIPALVLLISVPSGFAQEAGQPGQSPKGTTYVGTVSARMGSCVVAVLPEGAKVQPGDELAVGRPTVLVVVVKGREPVEAWADWQEAGRLKVRFLRGGRYAFGFVTQEKPLTSLGGQPVPNIRPGDILYRPAP